MQASYETGNPVVSLIITLAIYAYFSYSFMVIANKTNTPNGWMAWIPIINIILILNIAKKPVWWIILFLIPLVNLIFAIITMIGVAEARGKGAIWGVLIIIPFINLIVPGYLAFTD